MLQKLVPQRHILAETISIIHLHCGQYKTVPFFKRINSAEKLSRCTVVRQCRHATATHTIEAIENNILFVAVNL